VYMICGYSAASLDDWWTFVSPSLSTDCPLKNLKPSKLICWIVCYGWLGGRKSNIGQSGSTIGSREVRMQRHGGILRTDKPRSPTRGWALGHERPGLCINGKR
jgi:hypothetical protein